MRRVAGLVLGGLTLVWVAYTLYVVGRYGGAVIVDTGTTSRIMGVREGERVFSAIGLTYTGIGGAVLVVLELFIVVAALLLSVSKCSMRRRLGLVLLCLWTLLWLGNSLWMETLTGWRHASGTSMLAVATIVVLAWSALRWRAATPD